MWSPKIVLKQKRKLIEDRANAALLLKYSNAVVFKWHRGKFKCAYCTQNYADFSEFRSHSDQRHNKLDLFEKNGVVFPLNVDITNLICNICNHLFNEVESLKDHLIDVHSISIDRVYPDGVIPYRLTGHEFRCVICDSIFVKFMTLFIHMNEHYPSFVCDYCGKGFSAKKKLRSHKALHKPGKFKCKECDAVFANRIAKNRHVSEKHRPKERYRCPICDEHLNSYHRRLQHLKKVHGQVSEYRCKYCSEVFVSGTARYGHVQRIHLKKWHNRKKKVQASDDVSADVQSLCLINQ